MAVKITGMFRHPLTKQLFDSPVLVLYPILNYKNTIDMKVSIIEQSSGVIFMNNINKDDLTYQTNENHFDGLIDALETYVIEELTVDGCLFEKGYTLPEINYNEDIDLG
jgi:hypothetical protein